MDTSEIFNLLRSHTNPQKAIEMSAYMRNKFPFIGISSPERKLLCKDFLKLAKRTTIINWEFVDSCWEQPEREFQYLAVDYLTVLKAQLIPCDIEKLKYLSENKSWWDTIDGLDKLVGEIAIRHAEVNDILLEWSVSENFWLRRIAIDHQLQRKEKTNAALLEQIIVNNLGQTEFFINKAIGWSLRAYSKTNPDWVRDFLIRYNGVLHPLSKREASKYI